MPDSRLYQLIEHLRAHGVGVCPDLHWDEYNPENPFEGGWSHTKARMPVGQMFAHAAIVVGCMKHVTTDDAPFVEWNNQGGHSVYAGGENFPDTPHGWLLAVAHARGIAVPEELRKEAEGE